VWVCPLAVISWVETTGDIVSDCREQFDNLVELTKRKAGGGCCTVTLKPDDLANASLNDIIAKLPPGIPAKICLAPGAYVLREPIAITRDNLTIESCPDGAILRGRNTAAFRFGMIAISGTNVALRDLALEPAEGRMGRLLGLTAAQMDAIADLMDQFSLGEVRVTHEQNLVLPHVRKKDLPAIYAKLKELDFASPNAGLITDIIACPGLDYCDLANARSIPIAQKLAKRFENLDRQHQIGELKIKISGCINACGHHHAGHIGILGVDKKGVEFYQLVLGGSGAEDASVGTIMGPGFGEHEIGDAVERVVNVYLAERKTGERFLDTYRRIGMEKFKAAAYQEAVAA